jgi:hypothetical protein
MDLRITLIKQSQFADSCLRNCDFFAIVVTTAKHDGRVLCPFERLRFIAITVPETGTANLA